MQAPKPPKPRRGRRRPQISCTECRRRKQKCNRSSGEGPCTQCSRRYPPVECYVQELEDANPTRKGPVSQEEDAPSDTVTLTNPGGDVANEPGSTGYPAIPLSRILHPAHEPPSSSDEIQAISPPTPPSWAGSGFIIEDDPEAEARLAVEQRGLKFRDPWSKEAIRKALSISQSPTPLAGVLTMLNSFSDMPISTTLRNAELFHFFHYYVAPRLCSIDGGSIPPLFAKEILPWQIKSPLMPNVAILMASATQDHLYHSDTSRPLDTLVIKAHVLRLVNRFIQEDFHMVGNQAMRIVIHLVVIEFFWGNAESLWPHMEGIKQMLNLHGGLEGMTDPLNMHVLIVTDYELACAFEKDLTFMTTEKALATKLPIMETYPEKFRCPLLDYPIMFKDSREALNLSIAAAEILDDVRFLTVSIHSPLLCPDLGPVKTFKIQSTAAWLHKRLEAMPNVKIEPDTDINDVIFDTIRITALVYTSSIMTLTPMSTNFPTPLKERFLTNLFLVGLRKWNDLPGIFLWILLVAVPSSGGDHRGLFLRKQMACTGMALGLEDFYRGTAYLRAFWVVQRWIETERLQAAGDKE